MGRFMLAEILGTAALWAVVILAFGLLVFIHEGGHFLAAKRVGVRVEIFSLGFGKRLWGFRRGGTDYRISLIPLGGYVKMAGEMVGEARRGAPDEFGSRTIGERFRIIAAGPLMNLLLAVPLFAAAAWIGGDVPSSLVGRVAGGGDAERAGLKPGDRILLVDGRPAATLDEMNALFAIKQVRLHFRGIFRTQKDTEAILRVQRDGRLVDVRWPIDLAAGLSRLELDPVWPQGVDAVEEESPAAQAKLLPGDRILEAGGRPIEDLDEWIASVECAPLFGAELPSALDLRIVRPAFDAETRRETGREERAVTVALVPAEIRAPRGLRLERGVGVLTTLDGEGADGRLFPGDQILSIDGKPVASPSEAQSRVRGAAAEPIPFEVRRAGHTVVVPVPTKTNKKAGGLRMAGFAPVPAWFVSPASGPEASEAGAFPGDMVVSIGDVSLLGRDAGRGRMGALRKALEEAGGEPVPVRVLSRGAPKPLRLTWPTEKRRAAALGIEAGYQEKVPSAMGPVRGAAFGVRRTAEMVVVTAESLPVIVSLLASRRASARDAVNGPVGIGSLTYQYARMGPRFLLSFLAIISINLGVINFLPIPVLDGGHLLFLALEKIQGRPLTERAIATFQYVGIALLLSLVLFATYNDILRLPF